MLLLSLSVLPLRARAGTHEPEKVREALDELKDLEADLKECERRIRFARDFDAIMDFFASVGELRRVCMRVALSRCVRFALFPLSTAL